MSQNFKAHYISGTHWDREWYRPFQEFRFLLVQLVDELLDLMETSPDFKYFQFDGQTCMLEDYLEIRPENRERLQKLISERRILIGPWFTMPDLFCPDDESLVRSLLLGRRISKEWGVEPMKVGFICDMFGHPSQTAQIFCGFDLHDCVMGRGANEHTTPMYFDWEAPDGSRVFTYKLQDAQGYGAFALPRAVRENPNTVAGGQVEGLQADLEAAAGDAEEYRRAQEKWMTKVLGDYINHETERANGDVIALMDTMDHIPPARDVALYLRLVREAAPHVEPQHSTLEMFFEDARQSARDLPVRRGELREPARPRVPYLYLIPNCVSSRVRMKQANDTTQNLLERWAEPLTTIANLEGAAIPEQFLLTAWKHLVTNHAHDSICGCSIDQVHRDMMYRYDQAQILADQLRHQALGVLTSRCAELARSKDEFTLTLVNPLPRPRDEAIVFDIDLPPEYSASFHEGFNTQELKAFTLEDAEGSTVPYQRLGMLPLTNERSRHAQFCFMSDGPFTRYTVAAHVALPALGFTSLRVVPSRTPVRTHGTLRAGPTAAQNEHLAIALDANGTLTLTDRASGETFTDLLTFEDRSEIGDGWFHGHSVNDEQIISSASKVQVSVIHDGPEMVTFRSTVKLQLPARYDFGQERPSKETVELVISSSISLRRGARVVDVETTIENNAEDHRLQLLLPSDATAAKTWLAHHPYDIVERDIAIDPETTDWQEMEQVEKPFLSLQAVGDAARGLAFLSAGGLHEGGVRDDMRRTMQVTLLRSFRRTISTGGETDGLEQGRITYRYALLPYRGELPRQLALEEVARLQSGVLTRQSGARPSGYPPLQGTAPPHQSFIELRDGHLLVSAIKPRESSGGLVVRLWNPSSEEQSETINFWKTVSGAQMLKLSEERDEATPLPQVDGNSVTVRAGAHQIVTIGVDLAE